MAGLPIIASDFPEMSSIVVDNGLGFTVNPENPQDIASKINTILSDPSIYQEMVDNTKRVAKDVYNWENQEAKLLDLYKQLAENKFLKE